jgi:hypothetical protein
LELDEREKLILVEAAGVADDLARLEGLLARAGDERQVIRLLMERRQQRLAYGRLLAQLDLDGGSSLAVSPQSRRASKAGRARWAKHNELEARRRELRGG